tara:strand:- start:1124 stop:2374 length:1251 start_codon:yes stop_codon:yes gene_type:complete
MKITEKAVKDLRPAENKKPYEVRYEDTQGFLVRVQPTGRITYYFEYRNSDKKRQRIKLGVYPTLKVSEARDAAAILAGEVAKKGDPAADKRAERHAVAPADLTLHQFIEEHYGPWAQTNLKSHAPTLTRLRAGFAPLLSKRLVDLTARDFEQHRLDRLKHKLATKKKPPTPQTLNRDQQTLRAALTRAIDWKLIDSNPLDRVKKAKEDRNRKIRALSANEEADILDTFTRRRQKAVDGRLVNFQKGARKQPKIPRYLNFLEPLFVLSLETGIRRGEAVGLLWSDIDFAGRTLTVRGEGAKSAQTRTVPLSTKAKMALVQWRAQVRGQGRVFMGLTVDSLKGQWVRLLKDAKVTGIRWHDLRHTFGTRCAVGGVPVVTIQRMMGHASITTTARYLHATDEDMRNAMDRLEKAAGGGA